MSIQASEMIWRYPAERSDVGTNGGRMTKNIIANAVKNNIWPDIPQSERDAGSTKYRKAFIHIANDDDLELVRPRVFVETPSPGDDSVTIFPGSFVDTQSGITGSEDQYGCGQLDSDVLASASSIDVMTEGAALDIFRDGDLIRISDKATVSGAGNEEYHTISGAPSYNGDVATITLVGTLANGFSASNTRVASVYQGTDPLVAAYSSFVVTTAGSGDFDDTTYPVLLDHKGSVYQSWTLTWTSATEFNIVGDTLGLVGTGITSSTVQPNNPDFSKPYFVMNNAGFSGVWAASDTITFDTSPCAIPIWYKRIIPALANSLSGDKVIVGIDGESS